MKKFRKKKVNCVGGEDRKRNNKEKRIQNSLQSI